MNKTTSPASITDEQRDAAAAAIARVVSDATSAYSSRPTAEFLERLAVDAAKALRAGFAEFNRAD